jgi:hypothetical protein
MSTRVLAALAPLHVLATWLFLHACGPGFPLDDAWGHMVYGRALSLGQGFAYNPGQPEAGVTAPLWTMIAALPAGLTEWTGWLPRPDAAMRVLGALLGLATAAVGWRLGARAGRWPAFFAGLLLTFDPLLLAGRFSGMELPLFGLLTLLMVESMLDGRTRATGWLAGLALLTRPEGLLLAGLALARAIKRKERPISLLLPVLFCALPFAAYNGWVAGQPWPNTWGNKAALTLDPGGTAAALTALCGDIGWGWATPLLLAVGTIALAGAERALPRLLLVISGTLLLGVLLSRELPTGFDPPRVPFYWERYVLAAWPPLLLVMGAGLASLVRTAWAGVYCRPLAAVALVGPLVLAGALARGVPAHASAVAARFAAECAQVEAQNVAAGLWIDQHLPADALVATHDAGAVRYFGRRNVLDIWGNNDARLSALMAESERLDGTGAREIPLSDVPVAARAAAEGAVPGIRLTEAEVEEEQGRLVYELEGVLDGMEHEIEVTAEGEVLEVEEPEGARAEAAVLDYLRARAPDALVVFPALWAAGHSPEYARLMRELPPDEAEKLQAQAADYAGFFGLTRRAQEFRVEQSAVVAGPLHQVLAVYVRP